MRKFLTEIEWKTDFKFSIVGGVKYAITNLRYWGFGIIDGLYYYKYVEKGTNLPIVMRGADVEYMCYMVRYKKAPPNCYDRLKVPYSKWRVVNASIFEVDEMELNQGDVSGSCFAVTGDVSDEMSNQGAQLDCYIANPDFSFQLEQNLNPQNETPFVNQISPFLDYSSLCFPQVDQVSPCMITVPRTESTTLTVLGVQLEKITYITISQTYVWCYCYFYGDGTQLEITLCRDTLLDFQEEYFDVNFYDFNGHMIASASIILVK